MHPFFNTTGKVFFLLLSWFAVAATVSGLLGIILNAGLQESLLLFVPLYFLILVFILPNYYACRGLPIRETPWLLLLGTHLLIMGVLTGLWMLIGDAYTGLLNSLVSEPGWQSLFDTSLYINLGIVVIQYEIVALIHYLYLALEKTKNLEQAALKQKLLISQAELQTLKATVNPHFLFNSLNTLSNIALSAPETVQRFCLLIAEFLRYSVAYSKKSSATLSEELEHVQNYLGIERERFGDRLETRFEIEESLMDVTVPPLILFPVVENAIKHGIDSCMEGGLLEVVVRQQAGSLVFEVCNPVDQLGRKLKGTGHGLSSVKQRLQTRYGEQALLKAERDNGNFKTSIYLPLQCDDEVIPE